MHGIQSGYAYRFAVTAISEEEGQIGLPVRSEWLSFAEHTSSSGFFSNTHLEFYSRFSQAQGVAALVQMRENQQNEYSFPIEHRRPRNSARRKHKSGQNDNFLLDRMNEQKDQQLLVVSTQLPPLPFCCIQLLLSNKTTTIVEDHQIVCINGLNRPFR